MQELKALRQARAATAKRYSITEVAHVLGITPPTYRKLERDPSLMTVAQIQKLSDYLGCSVEDIFLPQNDN